MELSSWDNNWPLNADAAQCETLNIDLDLDLDDDDEEFLRNILLQQPTISNSESHHHTQSLMQTNTLSFDKSGKKLRPGTFILSFDKSTIIPAASKSKPMKRRSDSEAVDHIMAERKRRLELSQKFIALSATIPGLKKADKTSILGGAISYVKVLEERVKELEEAAEGKKRGINKQYCTTSTETNYDHCCCELLPVVKAKMLDNEVLIQIQCEKSNAIELKILDLLENLHLFVTASSVLPFGNSAFGITIITQVGESYRMKVNDLVETLRRMLIINQTTSSVSNEL